MRQQTDLLTHGKFSNTERMDSVCESHEHNIVFEDTRLRHEFCRQ